MGHAAVVRGHDDQGVVLDLFILRLVEPVQQHADAVVHALEHGGHFRTALVGLGVAQFFVLGQQILFGNDRAMDGVVPKIEKEGFTFDRLDPFDRLFRQSLIQILAFGPRLQVADGVLVGRVIVTRPGQVSAANDKVKALVIGVVLRFVCQVPLPDVGSGVTAILQRLGQSIDLKGHMILALDLSAIGLLGRLERLWLRHAFARDGHGHPQSCRILARHNAGPGRRAEGAGCVGIGE